ncbi:MAG: polynucleotide adenylyltransferase, partial [Chloroflexi bacterium]|nr:polynucleotide adenylyltransferase [Chloroflexota bacterium]
LLTGDDLMRQFALAPGPLIGELLQRVREAQACGEVATPDEALRLVETALNESGSQSAER